MLNRFFYPLALAASFIACDKVENPDGLFDCVEFRNGDKKENHGNLSMTINDSTYVVPCKIYKRTWGSFDLIWSEYDNTCYREVIGGVSNFLVRDDGPDLVIDSVSFFCDPIVNFSLQTSLFDYTLVDHDAPLGAYKPNMDLYDVEFEVTEFNEDRNIMRGSFSATLYLDQSCYEPSLRRADSVLVIQKASFEAPVNYQ